MENVTEAATNIAENTSRSITNILNQEVGGYSLGHILTAAVTLIICLFVIRIVMNIIRRLLARTSIDARVQKYIASGLKFVMYVLTVIIVAQGLGVNMTSFVALLSVISLGLTLAVEDILGNFAGGLVIFTAHPFAIGDMIESSGIVGVVEETDLHHTKLLNPDGQFILIPNKDLAASKIINYTALGRRRVTVTVTTSYDAPTETVKRACEEAVAMTDQILKDPAPSVALLSYGASSIQYAIFCWVHPDDFFPVTFGLNEHLRESFAKNNVEMTYDHLNVHIVENQAK